MKFPDGSTFPDDYTYPVFIDRICTCYKKTKDKNETPRRFVEAPPALGYRRMTYQIDDHPVSRAYDALVRLLDPSLRAHRELLLEFLTLAIPMDDWGIVSGERAAKITTSIQERNRMEDLELLLARLDTCERRQETMQSIMADEARAQGDAASRAAGGILTQYVER